MPLVPWKCPQRKRLASLQCPSCPMFPAECQQIRGSVLSSGLSVGKRCAADVVWRSWESSGQHLSLQEVLGMCHFPDSSLGLPSFQGTDGSLWDCVEMTGRLGMMNLFCVIFSSFHCAGKVHIAAIQQPPLPVSLSPAGALQPVPSRDPPSRCSAAWG